MTSAARYAVAPALLVASLAVSPAALAQAPANTPPILFENVRIFDGKGSALSAPSNVLIKGNVIERISTAPIAVDGGTAVIAGGGRTLMPGLIDAHWHAMLIRVNPITAMGDVGYNNLLAAAEATATLMRGFTTVRDLGGPAFGLKRAIDEGITAGPRIYPAGAIITVTSGHGDFRQLYELPRTIGGMRTRMEQVGGSIVADSPDEVRLRAREQLMQGASQIKLTAGGGVASPHSPLDVSTFTEEETIAAVQAAENWGTYVAAHAYTPAAIQRAVASGVKVIEHGHLMDEATAKLMAEKGTWLSFQPFTDAAPAATMAPANQRRLMQVIAGTERTVALAKKYKLKMAFGTDVLFSPAAAARQGAELAKMQKWYSAAEALAMATGTNGELLKLSGPRDPYPGKLGVVEEGALADLLLVDGDPVANIRLIEDPAKNFVVIMKDGSVYKNTLGR